MRTPLLLLHGVTNSALIWNEVIPLLRNDFEIIAPTAAGHRGGPLAHRPTTIANLVDDAERILDARSLDNVDVAGNSMGGFIAIELARRGRARSVCAFSPAGFWTPGSADHNTATRQIRRGRRLARCLPHAARLAMRVPVTRKWLLRPAAQNGERLTAESARDFIDDLIGCSAADDLLETTDSVGPLEPVPCPITLAWSQRDHLFPPAVNGRTARDRLPGAHYRELPGVGHVPMIDDPRLCAQVIREAVTRAPRQTGNAG